MTTAYTRTGRSRPLVAVYGSATVADSDATYLRAQRLGELLGRRDADVACGGYGGVMEGVSRGASEAGASAIGYTVGSWQNRTPNCYLSEERPCSDLYERLRRLIEEGDALVALGGGIGTLAEVMLAWNHLYLGLIDARPLIVVGKEWKHAVESLSGVLEIGARHLELLTLCDDVDDVMNLLEEKGIVR